MNAANRAAPLSLLLEPRGIAQIATMMICGDMMIATAGLAAIKAALIPMPRTRPMIATKSIRPRIVLGAFMSQPRKEAALWEASAPLK